MRCPNLPPCRCAALTLQTVHRALFRGAMTGLLCTRFVIEQPDARACGLCMRHGCATMPCAHGARVSSGGAEGAPRAHRAPIFALTLETLA